MITERDFGVLRDVARYSVLSRMQVQRLNFPDDDSGRVTRRRLQTLVDAKLLNRTPTPVFNSAGGSAWPAYYSSRKGLELLAEQLADERFLGLSCQTPQAHHLLHWLAVSETHILLDQAIAAQTTVSCDGWINEWDTVCTEETLPEKRYRLYSLLQSEPRLVCAPDAGFLLAAHGYRKIFYLEQDRQTSGVKQIAASKCRGYAGLLAQQGQRHHFPQANVAGFTVLLIAPNERRRDALRKAFGDKPAAHVWKFASVTDLSVESFLFQPVFYPVNGDPAPIVRGAQVEVEADRLPNNTQQTEQPTREGRLCSPVEGESRATESAS